MALLGSKSQDVIIEGDSAVKTAGIDNRKLAKLQYILTTGLYKDGISAVIVELCNNGMDSIIESGKDPIANPVIVKLFRDSNMKYNLSIKDVGIGMDSDFFENRFMNLLDSTKEDNNDTIGHFGIGGKSWSSLNRSVIFTITKDGKQSKYLCYKGEEFIDYDPIYKDIDTTEENGVLFELQINDWSEYSSFCTKAKQKLAYYDTVALFIDGILWNNSIYRNDIFQWSSNSPSTTLHLCLKDVLYTIDYEKLGISRINIPIALRFGLDSGLVPTPSREDILFNKESVEIIKNKIKEVANYFVAKYNETVKDFDTLADAAPFIEVNSKYVSLNETSFEVSCLEQYSDTKFSEPKIKGINLRDGLFYKKRWSDFFEEYAIIAHDSYNNSWKKKHISYEFSHACSKYKPAKKIVVFQGNLAGNVKEYLRDKYGSHTIYVEKHKDMKLMERSYHVTSYRGLLLLDKNNKSQWRDFIKEWQYVKKTILDEFFVDESNIENKEEYITWLEEKKKEQKENRAKGIYKGKYLNKQEGDITIGYGRLSALDKKTVVFEKKAVPIKDLSKQAFITIYGEDTTENKLQLAKYYPFTEKFKVKLALVGKRELNKIPKLHNFMTEMEYSKTKQFRKYCTAVKAQEAISIYSAIAGSTEELIKNVIRKHYDDVEHLRSYITENLCMRVNADLKESMMALAEATNLFDLETMVIVNRVQKDLERYDFLPLLKTPHTWEGEEVKKKYSRIIHQMLLFKKLYAKQFPDFEIVEAVPVEVLEEMYVTEVGELEEELEIV